MNYLRFTIILLIIILLSTIKISAQKDEIRVNFSGSNVPFMEIVNEIEKNHNIKFFFNHVWIDSLKLTVNYNGTPLNQVLNEYLLPYKIYYYIDNQHNIILTKEKPIQSDLTLEFIEPNSDQNNIAIDENLSEKYSSIENQVVDEIITIGTKTTNGNTIATITGYIKDADNGEPLTGATVFIEELKTGTIADADGYYMLSAKPATYHMVFRTFGMKTIRKEIIVYSDGQLNIDLYKEMVSLTEVVVRQDKYNNIRGMQIGLEKLTMKEIKELPLAVGESDILKASLMLPGIQTVGESAAGYNVRGGSADQNLFIINGVPVFNTSHMFGFFSTFNPEVIKDFKLFKSNIPVEYGGRISSVFDIRTKQGNKKNFTIKGGISPVTAKLSIEGPLIKDKSSFILGIRSTYSDWILKQIQNPEIKNSNVYFNDIIANISHEVNEKNLVTIFGYYSKDNYKLASDINYNYYNYGSSINWKHLFTKRFYSNITAVISDYHLEVTDNTIIESAYKFKHNVKYYEINESFNYLPNTKHEIKFGFNSILHKIDPGSYEPVNEESVYKNSTFETESALESSVYIGDMFEINHKLSIEGGLRYTLFNYLGPKTVYSYQENSGKSESTVTDTTIYDKYKSIQRYSGLDIRLSFRYLINNLNSLKIGYSRINQYLFLLTNTVSISPTDRWKLCDPYTKPIVGDQYNVGYYRNFNNTNFEASAEIYYKENKNVPDFKNGADLVKNENIERDIISGFGRNYGLELMVKKNNGRLSGWANYSYSRSELKFSGSNIEETINYGEFYPANYDKPHNVNVVTNFRINRRLSFSTNFTYSTGRPATFPVSKYNLNGNTIIDFSNRNAERIPDYWRVDASINLEGNLERKKAAHSFWMLSIYNLTGRKNAYSVYFEQENGRVKGYKLAIYGVPIITLSYNFKLGNYASN